MFMRDSKYSFNGFRGDREGLSYFLGLVCADGSVNEKKQEVRLYSTDLDIIMKIKSRMEFTGLVHDFGPKGSGEKGLIFGGHIGRYFISLGLSNKEENSISNFKNIDKYHFLRGFLDGDGTIELVKRKSIPFGLNRISFLCREKMGKDLQGLLGGRLRKIPLKGTRTCQLYELNFYGRCAYDLAHKLWDNSSIYLDRKYKKYLQIRDNKYPQFLSTGISRRPIKNNPDRCRVYVRNKYLKIDKYANSYEEALRILKESYA